MRKLVVVGAVAALVLAGCGSGGGSSGGGDSGPIKILQLAPYESQNVSLPFMKTSAEAATTAVNEAGGIGGRDVELITCNTRWDPNETVKCAQQAIRDHAAAVVGILSNVGGQILPLFEKAEIPVIGANPNFPVDAQNPASFLLDSGVPGYAAMPIAAKQLKGAKTVYATMLDNTDVAKNMEILGVGAKVAGVQILGNAVVPADAVDYSLYAQRIVDSGADAIVGMPSGPDFALKFYNALDAVGAKVKGVFPQNSFPQSVIDEAGAIANGTYYISGVPAADESNATGKQYVEEMKKYEPGEKVIGTVGLRSWAAVHLFAEVAKGIDGDVSAKSVWKALNETKCLDFMWLKCLNFAEPGPLSEYPRVPAAASVVFLSEVVNGKIEARNAFDPFK